MPPTGAEERYGAILPFPAEQGRSGLPDENGKLQRLCPMSDCPIRDKATYAHCYRSHNSPVITIPNHFPPDIHPQILHR